MDNEIKWKLHLRALCGGAGACVAVAGRGAGVSGEAALLTPLQTVCGLTMAMVMICDWDVYDDVFTAEHPGDLQQSHKPRKLKRGIQGNGQAEGEGKGKMFPSSHDRVLNKSAWSFINKQYMYMFEKFLTFYPCTIFDWCTQTRVEQFRNIYHDGRFI